MTLFTNVSQTVPLSLRDADILRTVEHFDN